MFDQKLLHLSNEVVKNTMLPNKKLRAKPGTPLDYIVNSVLPAEAELNTESLNQALSCVIDKSNAPFSFTGSKVLHVVLDQIDDQYIKPLRQQLKFTRNTVNPVIQDAVKRVETILSERSEPNTSFTLHKINVPDFVYGRLLNYIEGFAVSLTAGQQGPAFKPTLSHVDANEITQLCQSDFEEVNEGILQLAEEWKAIEGTDLFDAVFTNFLLAPNHVVAQLMPSHRNFMQAIVAFLVADKLVKEPIASLNISSENLNVWGAFFRNACARIIKLYLGMFSSAVRTKTLIRTVDKENKVIEVYAPVYDEFDSTEKADIMMGILHSNTPNSFKSLEAVVENAEVLVNRGKVAAELSVRMDKNRLATRYNDVILQVIIQLVEEAKASDENSDLRSFIDTTKPAFEYRPVVNKYLNDTYPGNSILKTDLRLVIAEVVCHCFFKDTMASVILRRLIEVEVERPDATPAAIVSIGLISMLTEWVAGQIELVDC